MADDTATTTPTETTPPPVVETTPPTGAPPAGERTFTQADVDRIVRERLARERANRPAEPARPNAQPTAAPPPSNPPASGPVPSATYDAEALSDALAEFSFDKEQRAEIRAAARRDNPGDLDAFVSRWARMFGKQPGQATVPATPAAGTPPPSAVSTPAAPVVPVTSRGMPPNPATPTEDTPIMSMSEADKRALAARLGDKVFADRLLKELAQNKTKVRPRLL